MQPPGKRGKKIYIFHTGLMTKMAAMPIYGKNLKKSSSELLGRHHHVSCQSTFSKGFSSETTGQISFKFHIQPFSKGGKKVYIFRPGHILRWPPCPYMVKTLKNLLRNYWASCLETWYVASCIAYHHFGTVTLCLQKIGKFISKTNITL